MRTVLDTNVLISGLISNSGPPHLLIEAWLQDRLTLITGQPQIDELADVLSRERMRRWIDQSSATILVENMHVRATVVTLPSTEPVRVSPDPKDDMILAIAAAGDADCIISGDRRHLLALGDFRGIPIIRPADGLARLDS